MPEGERAKHFRYGSVLTMFFSGWRVIDVIDIFGDGYEISETSYLLHFSVLFAAVRQFSIHYPPLLLDLQACLIKIPNCSVYGLSVFEQIMLKNKCERPK